MNARAVRALVVAVALAALPAAGVAAAEATLGASIQSRVYLSDDPYLRVLNRSTIPVAFAVEPAGDLQIVPARLVLKPGQSGTFRLSGEADDGTKLAVHVTQLDKAVKGTESTALLFSSTLYHHRPFDPLPWLIGGGIGLGGILVLVLSVGWLRNNVVIDVRRRRTA